MTIVIPERGAPEMLASCLDHLREATARVPEPTQVIVVVNGSAIADYEAIKAAHGGVEWIHFDEPMGFTRALLEGIARATQGSVYLLNNDMLLEPDALEALLRWRAGHVFALASQIFFQDTQRRREETGWTSMHFEDGLPRPRHNPPSGPTVRGTVWAGAGSALFHVDLLRKLLPESLPFDPFYWEDTNLGVRAWRLGYESLFCPASIAWHKHRATVQRFYSPTYVNRVFERNRLQFQLRNPFPRQSLRAAISHILGMDSATRGELGSLASCVSVWRARWQAFRSPFRDVDYASLPAKRYHLPPSRPRLIVVAPFALLPPRHGSAVRTTMLAAALAKDYDVVLLSDEQPLYDEPGPDASPFASVHLVSGRPDEPPGLKGDRRSRIDSHSHSGLARELMRLNALYRPDVVLLEHMELAGLIDTKLTPRPRFILHLHDVLLSDGIAAEAKTDAYEIALMSRFDGLVTCSQEDQVLLSGTSQLVPNGYEVDATRPYLPSHGKRSILFIGPFRASINFDGIRQFLRNVYPQIERTVPAVSLRILGGPGAKAVAARDPSFASPSIEVIESVENVRDLLDDCALTINPQPDLRGSSLKVIESIAAGRICVSTRAGARGWLDREFKSLIALDNVEHFVEPLQRLLLDETYRAQLEGPNAAKLADCSWEVAGNTLRQYIGELLDNRGRP